jgi:hypothetical protein
MNGFVINGSDWARNTAISLQNLALGFAIGIETKFSVASAADAHMM